LDEGREKRVLGFGGETWEKETLGRPSRRWEDNMKMALQEVGCGVWTELSWRRFLDHTHRRATVGRAPLGRVISSSKRPLS
jgi:hypothetical protein